MASVSADTADSGRAEEIVAAAAAIFSRKGYVATTTREIGEAVGIDNSSLYYYIKSKEALLYEIVRSVYEPLGRQAELIEAEGGDEATQLRRLVTAHLCGFADNVEATRVCYADWQHLRGDYLQDIRGRRASYGHYVQRLIIGGQQSGWFNPRLDPATATHAVLTLLNSLNLWYNPEHSTSIETVMDSYLTIIFSGLAA